MMKVDGMAKCFIEAQRTKNEERLLDFRQKEGPQDNFWGDCPIEESTLLFCSYKSSIRVEAPFHIKLGSDLRKSGERNDTMNEQSPNMP